MVNRFEVYLVNLDPRPGDDPKNTRPAAVVSPDEMNRHVGHVLVAPISSSSPGWPTRIATEFLNSERFVVLDQLMTVEKARLVKKIGELDEPARAAVLACLSEMFAE
jgi:mRNA interferase MazF